MTPLIMYALYKTCDDDISTRRKKLAEIRSKLASQSTQAPFSLALLLNCGQPIHEFVVSLALNIHKKRTSKKDPH
jgi:hypothetical protein